MIKGLPDPLNPLAWRCYGATRPIRVAAARREPPPVRGRLGRTTMTTPKIHESTDVAEGMRAPAVDGAVRRRRLIGLGLGVVLAVLVYLAMPGEIDRALAESLTAAEIEVSAHAIRATAAIAVLMGVWWMTEAIPLAATALVPLVAFPLLQVDDFGPTAAPYASGTIFLFMGGFILALALQRWNLHRRIALITVLAVGTSPKRLVGGFMIATGFMSMWVSNTATAVMMLPIGISVLSLVGQLRSADEKQSNFGASLMLGIAYAASIGSLGTLIGTPPNALLRAYLEESHGITIGFGQWMLFGVPLSVVFLLFCWWLLTHVLYRPEIDELPGGREVIQDELRRMGPTSNPEKLVGLVFVVAALSWVFIPTLLPESGITDESIAMVVALALFIIPARPDEGIALMDWHTAKEVPWDVLLLFGGGLALSAQFSKSGLSLWIGDQAAALGALPILLIMVAVAAMVIFLTELTSNTATAAAFLPIIGGVAIGLDVDVMLLVVPVALAATCAFMLPVATPPNAIAFGSGYIRMGQMVRAGVGLNLAGIVLITVAMMTLGQWVLGLTI
jgi:sodium-dependent dicarboxylate transporter 2/3/5